LAGGTGSDNARRSGPVAVTSLRLWRILRECIGLVVALASAAVGTAGTGMPGYVLLGHDGVFRLGRDDASSVDEERTKRVVSAVPGAPGQVYGGTQVGNVCGAQVAGHV
jgi:hypothetical protein